MPLYPLSRTIARWVRRCCISRSSPSTGLESGTNAGGRHHLLDAFGGLGLAVSYPAG